MIEFKNKLKRTKVLEPVDQNETFDKEIKNLELVKSPQTNVTPCPLCCCAFLTSLAASKYVLLCRENFRLYDDQIEKPKYDTFLKSQVNVRVTNLSNLLLKKLSPNHLLDDAKIIDCRQETDDRLTTTVVNDYCGSGKPNYHVSETCEHCINSTLEPTPPILMEILFENQTVNQFLKFAAFGDGLELVALAGVTTGYCYKCEMKSIDSKISRGLHLSPNPAKC